MQHDKKFKAFIYTNNEFITTQVHGPTNLEDWQSSWWVFNAGMFILGEASVGPLDAYEEGIRNLCNMFPNA